MEFSGDSSMAMERVRIAADPSRMDEMCEAIGSLIEPTRAERGCLRCELYRGWPGPKTVLFESMWRTREDLIRHLKSDRYKSFLHLVELSTERPTIEFFFDIYTFGLEIVEEAREKLA